MPDDALCKQARRAIELRDFIGWVGLPSACRAADLFDGIPLDFAARPVRHLGETFRPANFVLLALAGYYRPMASFEQNRLILFDGMNPELAGGVAPLQRQFGAPEAQLDWYYGTVPIVTGEWVYPQRGLTLFLNTAADKALHIALYQPTGLDIYLATLRPHLRKTPSKPR